MPNSQPKLSIVSWFVGLAGVLCAAGIIGGAAASIKTQVDLRGVIVCIEHNTTSLREQKEDIRILDGKINQLEVPKGIEERINRIDQNLQIHMRETAPPAHRGG
jgi:hypothetical protein